MLKDYPDIVECLERNTSLEPRAVNFFIKDNKKALEFVDNLIKFIGFTEFFLKRSITVNLKQLSRVTNEISGIPYNKLKQTSFEKLFLDNISNLVCGIYQKVLNFI